MSATDEKPQTPIEPLSIRQLTELLVKHYGLADGHYDLLVNYQIGSGAFGPSSDEAGPGIAISLSQVGLTPSVIPGHLTVDASKISRRKKKTASD